MWWVYYVLAAVLVLLAVGAYVIYRGYKRVKPKPITGIPIPPFTHPVLGHPDKMLHPLKHILRLEICEQARAPLHQLVLMKHASIFVNDAEEASRVLEEIPEKGAIYNSFRYDVKVPDMFASDGEDHIRRRKYLAPALLSMRVQFDRHSNSNNSNNCNGGILSDLMAQLQEHAESSKPVDSKDLFTRLAMDCVCEAAFGYQLGATSGSAEGRKLVASLSSLAEFAAGQGVYPSPSARPVPKEEMETAKNTWKVFLHKMKDVMLSAAQDYKNTHNGELDWENSFSHALLHMKLEADASAGAFVFGDPEMVGEIHQLLRHGHESICALLCWLVYVLFRVKKLRASLEQAILAHSVTTQDPYPAFLECVIKETLRKHPVAGNMTVRTPAAGKAEKLILGYEAPPGTPLHVHMYSLQNTTREWPNPNDFVPERWLDSEADLSPAEPPCERIPQTQQAYKDKEQRIAARKGYPRCPFASFMSNSNSNNNSSSTGSDSGSGSGKPVTQASPGVYEGVGWTEGTLSYFPFAVGERSCAGRHLALQVARRVLYEIAKSYRLDPASPTWNEDVGVSLNAVIFPVQKESLTLKVRKIGAPGAANAAGVEEEGSATGGGGGEKGNGKEREGEREGVSAGRGGGGGGAMGTGKAVVEDDGWADESDDELDLKED